MKIYLASASPTRKRLLQEILAPMDLSFQVMASEVDEDVEGLGEITQKEAQEKVVKLAKEKARKVAAKLGKNTEDSLIIAADTLIWFDNKIYGKPKDLADAYATLSMFRAKTHWAFTGLVIKRANKKKVFCAKAKVYMKKITDEVLQEYVDTKEPLGKAGSYAILQKAAPLFRVLEGEPSTVAGLPVERLKSLLREFAIRG